MNKGELARRRAASPRIGSPEALARVDALLKAPKRRRGSENWLLREVLKRWQHVAPIEAIRKRTSNDPK